MNIKSRLTYRLLFMVTGIWLIASASIYIFSAQYRKEEFYRRLESQGTTAARLLIEFEEVDARLLLKIESANPIKLPGQRISIYDFNNQEIFSTDQEEFLSITPETLDEIRLQGKINWQQGEVEIIGLLHTDQFERFVVVAAAHDIFGKSKLNNLRNILIIVFFIFIVVVAIGGRIYVSSALHPISQVVDEVNTIGAGNLDKRIGEGNGQDEIAILAITFNNMLDRLQDAFKSQRSFIANASHELRTPMTSILSQIDVTLLNERDKATYIEKLRSLRDDVRNLSELTTKLLLLARTDAFTENLSRTRIDALIWQIISKMTTTHPEYKVKVELSPSIDDEKQLIMLANEQMINSAFSNLIDNACKFSNDHEVKIFLVTRERGQLEITFTDNGIGIPSYDLNRITDPFFRASNASSIKGHGIGLSLVKKIMNIHNSSFKIDSIENKGTTITLILKTIEI